jgi:hypothetical protein
VSPRRPFRGLGSARKTRRTLERGGTGPAAELNQTLGAWPRVKITPMFGRWGYFVEARLFACFPLRPKDHDLWIRLGSEDQRRAVAAGCAPHRRMSATGWVECRVEAPRDVGRAMRWLRRAYESARQAVEAEEHRG